MELLERTLKLLKKAEQQPAIIATLTPAEIRMCRVCVEGAAAIMDRVTEQEDQ